ncbi:MAG: hypothetical protein KDL10_01975 [Kiritimatiellae bacterium]|nr:hypothetical protein [Kiritimatiellia bacterium]
MNTDPFSRRHFLAGVGQGTLAATLGPALAADLGLTPRAIGGDSPGALDFGDLEPLVRELQETPIECLQAGLVRRLRDGLPLKRLIAAAALANSRTFGGEDYIGFHTFMALVPALNMASLMPEKERALPVLKVLFRNTNRIIENGGRSAEVLHQVSGSVGGDKETAESLLRAVKAKDLAGAEGIFAGLTGGDVKAAFDALLVSVEENLEVHRTVLPYRAWAMIDIVGPEHAATLLRQSLHYCLTAEQYRRPDWEAHGKVLTRLLDEHRLHNWTPGIRLADDGRVDSLGRAIFDGTPDDAAQAVAEALAEGYPIEMIGEALALAANEIVLRDPGRLPAWEFPGKVTGSVHGDSVGVHASDSANARSKLSRAGSGRHAAACLILGAWQVARDRSGRGSALLESQPSPTKRQMDGVTAKDPETLLGMLHEAIRGKMQAQSAAVVARYGELGHPEGPVFSALLSYAVSEDGALHAEKYFQTVWDDFHSTRPAFRWRHLCGLARVTASEFGYPAPGQAEARELLGV